MRSGNPALSSATFQGLPQARGNQMTLSGTVNKTFILLALVIAGAFFTWNQALVQADSSILPVVMGGSALAGFAVAMVTIFKKTWAPFTAPLYAVLQGLFLGGLSSLLEQAYPGIVIQAVGLTFGVALSLLLVYRSGLIKVTENFRMGLVAATGGIALVYLVSLGMSFFGMRMPYIHEGGLIGIGFSLFVVTIAALNLVLDFDFIEQGAESGAPAYMEWYGAFGLMVTLIWLYIEILHLLAKLQKRD
jgi:uncharacterized YccA/Bax inhibitor family protein